MDDRDIDEDGQYANVGYMSQLERKVYAQALTELGNLSGAGLIINQLLAGQAVDLILIMVGLLIIGLLYLGAHFFARDVEG
jgi:hypothetical protein